MNVNAKAIQSFTPKISLRRAETETTQIPNPNYGEPYESAFISSADTSGKGFSDNFGEPHMPSNSKSKPEALRSPSRHISLSDGQEKEPEQPLVVTGSTVEVPEKKGDVLNPLAGEPYQPLYLIADSKSPAPEPYRGYS